MVDQAQGAEGPADGRLEPAGHLAAARRWRSRSAGRGRRRWSPRAGDIEIFGFHALETLQCMVERRDRKGKPQGVVGRDLPGRGRRLGGRPTRASGRGSCSTTPSAGATRSTPATSGRTRATSPRPPAATVTRCSRIPIAFVVEYADGFRATVLILNGHVDDTTIAAARLGAASREPIVSTLMYLPAPPGASFFNPLVLRIEDFFRTGKPPYPVERTLLTGGILDAALESRDPRAIAGSRPPTSPRSTTRPPADSGFIRTPGRRPRAE